MKNDIDRYVDFVDTVTSQPSKDLESLIARMRELDQKGFNVARMLTGVVGSGSEGGEFSEIVKKVLFQGKPLNQDTLDHLKIELSDELWYWVQKCLALDIDPLAIVQINIDKLAKRYPEGHFTINRSENRQAGDR